MESAAPLSTQDFNEGKSKPFGSSDIRFVTKGKALSFKQTEAEILFNHQFIGSGFT
ncbi:hypothetical protein [Pedobacter foliorum]|uniref:hypothetical protein n=1 Tax=Pedobacter foliorum TaxID=2739058 RepID=UPI0015652D21|nr:hypothetical protein [Pedobacter foliorum]NRF39532.1 hypothetical protein [Pedobacter foliorum]